MKRLLRSSVNWMPPFSRSWIKHIPVISSVQRWMVNDLLSDQPFVHRINAGPAKNLMFEITLPIDKAVWAGTYEAEFASEVRSAIEPGNVCYDIGGYRGYMAGTMALAGAAQVIVFEPLPENQSALRRLCELNPRLPIEVKPVAVGATDGRILLRRMPDPSMAKVATSDFQKEIPAVGEIDVAIRTIDSLVISGEISKPNLIKIDVEGAEADVLRGANKVLSECRPTILLEVHSQNLETYCRQELVQCGYNVRRLEPQSARTQQTSHLVATPA